MWAPSPGLSGETLKLYPVWFSEDPGGFLNVLHHVLSLFQTRKHWYRPGSCKTSASGQVVDISGLAGVWFLSQPLYSAVGAWEQPQGLPKLRVWLCRPLHRLRV